MQKVKKLILGDEAISTGINFVDRISVPTQRLMTDAGQMIVPCAFARTGTQVYTAEQLKLTDKEPDELITVHRDEKHVFDKDSMSSFRSSPVTLGHPKDKEGNTVLVTADNSKELQVGMLEGMPIRDEDLLTGCLVIANKDAIKVIDEGEKELSAGYVCDIELIKDGDDEKYVQTNIRANHIAIVKKGRAGAVCSIADEALETTVLNRSDLAKKAPPFNPVTPKVVLDRTPITDEQIAALTKLDKLEKEIELVLGDKGFTQESINKFINDTVKVRVDVVNKARFIADITDVEDKTNTEIVKMVVESQSPDLDVSDKSDEYMQARFDIMFDEANKETPMSDVLRQMFTKKIEDEKDVVEEARQRSIDRYKKTVKK